MLARIPDTPGLEQADDTTQEWVVEFLSCFGGRVAAAREETASRLALVGYDSRQALLMVEKSELLELGVLPGDSKRIMAQLLYFRDPEGRVDHGQGGEDNNGVVGSNRRREWDMKIKWPAMKDGGSCAAPAAVDVTALIEKVATLVNRRSEALAEDIKMVLKVTTKGADVQSMIDTGSSWEDAQLAGELAVDMPPQVHRFLVKDGADMQSGMDMLYILAKSRGVASNVSKKSLTKKVVEVRAATHKGALYAAVVEWEDARRTLEDLREAPSGWQLLEALDTMVSKIDEAKSKVALYRMYEEMKKREVKVEDVVEIVQALAQEWRHDAAPVAAVGKKAQKKVSLAAASRDTPCLDWGKGECTRDRCRFAHDPAAKGAGNGPCYNFEKGKCDYGDKCKFVHEGVVQVRSVSRSRERGPGIDRVATPYPNDRKRGRGSERSDAAGSDKGASKSPARTRGKARKEQD